MNGVSMWAQHESLGAGGRCEVGTVMTPNFVSSQFLDPGNDSGERQIRGFRIEGASQLTVKWRDYPAPSRWGGVISGSLQVEEELPALPRGGTGRPLWPLRMGGAVNQGVWVPQKVENKEAYTRKHSPANILILALVRPISAF